jgi:hypothetical protein
MAGNKAGGIKTRETNYERHGDDHYKRIGALGGKSKVNVNPETGKALKGFAISGKASEAGKLGGARSKRGKSK